MMGKVTMSFSFPLADKLFEKLESISNEVGKPISDVMGDMLESDKEKITIKIHDILYGAIRVYEKHRKSKMGSLVVVGGDGNKTEASKKEVS